MNRIRVQEFAVPRIKESDHQMIDLRYRQWLARRGFHSELSYRESMIDVAKRRNGRRAK